jgi:hypothetical protein
LDTGNERPGRSCSAPSVSRSRCLEPTPDFRAFLFGHSPAGAFSEKEGTSGPRREKRTGGPPKRLCCGISAAVQSASPSRPVVVALKRGPTNPARALAPRRRAFVGHTIFDENRRSGDRPKKYRLDHPRKAELVPARRSLGIRHGVRDARRSAPGLSHFAGRFSRYLRFKGILGPLFPKSIQYPFED